MYITTGIKQKVTHPPGHGVAILTVVRRDLNTALATDDDEEIIGQFSLLAQHIIFHVSFIHRLSQNGGDCLFLNIEQSTHNNLEAAEKKIHTTHNKTQMSMPGCFLKRGSNNTQHSRSGHKSTHHSVRGNTGKDGHFGQHFGLTNFQSSGQSQLRRPSLFLLVSFLFGHQCNFTSGKSIFNKGGFSHRAFGTQGCYFDRGRGRGFFGHFFFEFFLSIDLNHSIRQHQHGHPNGHHTARQKKHVQGNQKHAHGRLLVLVRGAGGGQQQGHDVFGGGDEEGQFREPKQHFVFVGGEIIQIATSDKTHQHRDTGTAEGWHINQHARQHHF